VNFFSGNFLSFYLTGFFAISAIDSLTAVFPVYLNSIFHSGTQVGLVVGIYPVLSIFLRTKISKFVFSRPIKKVLFLNLFLMIFSHLGYVFSKNVFIFILFRSIFGIGICGFFLTLLEGINREISGEKHPQLYGIFSTIFIIPLLFSPALGEKIYRTSDFNFTIFLSILFFILCGIFIFFIKDENLKPSGFSTEDFYKNFLKRHGEFVFLFVIISVYSTATIFLPILSEERNFLNYAYAFTFIAVSTIIIRFFLGWIFVLLGTFNCLLLASFLLAVAIFIFGQAQREFSLFLAGFLFGCGWAFFESNYIPSILKDSPRKSELISIYGVVFDSAFFLGPFLGGIYRDVFNTELLYITLSFLPLIGILYYKMFKKIIK